MCTACNGDSVAHKLRSRFHAWFLDSNEGTMHKMYGAEKQALLAGVAGDVVEIGPGAGANLRYYPRSLRLIAVEPNAAMHDRLRQRARQHGIELDIRRIRGERLDLPDASADVVVATLLLCSVADPAAVVAEIRRILRPGGRYVFIEHVADDRRGPVRLTQRLLHRPHAWLFEGCQTDRTTGDTLAAAGFRKLELHRRRFMSPMFWVAPHVVGTAYN